MEVAPPTKSGARCLAGAKVYGSAPARSLEMFFFWLGWLVGWVGGWVGWLVG